MRPVGWSRRRQGELRGWIAAGWGALGVLAVVLLWELYKFAGPAEGVTVGAVAGESGSGVMILPRTHDRAMPQYAALFDPQTCGGLLIGVSPAQADALLAALHDAGDPGATTIGRAIPAGNAPPRIELR